MTSGLGGCAEPLRARRMGSHGRCRPTDGARLAPHAKGPQMTTRRAWAIAVTRLGVAATAITTPERARAQAAVPVECEPLVSEIRAVQQRAVSAVQVLSGDEDCA